MVDHIANYLAGEHEKRVPKNFLQRPIFGPLRQRLTPEEQAPTAEAPWGYDVTGRKRSRREPTDLLADPNWAPRPDLLAKGRARRPAPDTHLAASERTAPPGSLRATTPRPATLGAAVKDAPGGALVGTVHPGTPAERAGLKPDDVIVAVEGTPVDDAATLARLVQAMQARGSATVTVRRAGAPLQLRILSPLSDSRRLDARGAARRAVPLPERRALPRRKLMRRQ